VGCRYAVCTGVDAVCTRVDSSSWDDSIDHAVVEAELAGRRPESKTVMTTWHQNETLEEVVTFFLNHTTFDDFMPSFRLALHLGGTEQECREGTTLVMEEGDGAPRTTPRSSGRHVRRPGVREKLSLVMRGRSSFSSACPFRSDEARKERMCPRATLRPGS
jgi:hypothetical protein